MKKLYKILIDGKSCHGGDMAWNLPVKKNGKWAAGKWHHYDGDVKICEQGLHLTTERFEWYKMGCTAYEAEAKDVVEWEDDKCVAKSVRLLRPVPHPKWWIDLNEWIPTLKTIPWMKPDGKPDKEWRLFPDKDAAWDAARDVAWDAVLNAAWDAARDAVRDVAWDAVLNAAWDAARDAVGDAWAWDAARNVVGDAARDAALYASTAFVCDGSKLPNKHRVYARKRMEVWQKGYGLLCDVDGVLYVFEKI